MAVTSPRSNFKAETPTVPTDYADIEEWVRIIALFANRISPAVFRLFDHKGEFGALINATYDDTTDTFSRLDTSKIAWWINVRHLTSIPGEESFAGAKGIVFWRARANASQPLSGFANVNGWEARLIITEFGELVIPGAGLEMDGNGFLPYGRVTHYTDSVSTPTAELTGLLKNLYLDFSDTDVEGDPSWFAGFDGLTDRFIIKRWAAGVSGATNGSTLFQMEADGSSVFVGPTRPAGYTIAGGLPSAASYTGYKIYISDETGGPTWAISNGTNWLRDYDRVIAS